MADPSPLGGFVICRPCPIKAEPGEAVLLQFQSDLHYGAPHVDYKLIKSEWQWARDNGARIAINGDIFDGIFAQDRKRYSADALHPRLRGRRDALTAAVEWAAEEMAPYADLIDMIGVGNHDTACEKYFNVDPVGLLIQYLTRALPKNSEHVIHHGGYTGFIDYRIRSTRETSNARGGQRWVVYYHHGSGGAAPVTKGLIDFNRRDTFVNADLLWLGHKHNRLNVSVQKLVCPLAGYDVTVREVRHVMTGGYFRTYVGQSQDSLRRHGRRSNYAADAGMAPQGAGGARVQLTTGRDNRGVDVCVIQ